MTTFTSQAADLCSFRMRGHMPATLRFEIKTREEWQLQHTSCRPSCVFSSHVPSCLLRLCEQLSGLPFTPTSLAIRRVSRQGSLGPIEHPPPGYKWPQKGLGRGSFFWLAVLGGKRRRKRLAWGQAVKERKETRKFLA